jgi:putative pyoverdin transport system ATP-binding/permease protein
MLEIGKLLSYLFRMSRHIHFSRAAIAFALLAGLASGIGVTGLLAIIAAAIAGGPDPQLLYKFIGLCILVPVSRMISQGIFNVLTTQAVFETRLQSCRRILDAPLRRLEENGSHRLLATLTEDVTTLSTALTQIPLLCLQVGVVVACLIYLGWLSWWLLLILLGFIAVGSTMYIFAMGKARRYFGLLREETDRMFAHFRSLIHGAKELKLHLPRRKTFISSALVPTGHAIRRYSAIGNLIFTGAAVGGNLLFFISIGFLLFALPSNSSVDTRVVAGYALSLIYMMTPLEVIFQVLPNLSRAAAAMRKLDRLGIDLASQVPETSAADETPVADWQRLELAGVHYAYSGDAGESFSTGPIDLAFRSGEIVFITGGNGSGKSTLAKILTGLYIPDKGEILLDGQPITSENRESFRQLFSTVFADFFLFEDLVGIQGTDLDAVARDYLVRLQLEKKVKVEGGVFSTLDLSQGQRKRLALLTAYMENRPIYLFDEWAADQDPQFKAIFYFEIVPELKARGKTVFVISHDDQYYSLGDRLIKMKDGQIEWDRMQDVAAVNENRPTLPQTDLVTPA